MGRNRASVRWVAFVNALVNWPDDGGRLGAALKACRKIRDIISQNSLPVFVNAFDI